MGFPLSKPLLILDSQNAIQNIVNNTNLGKKLRHVELRVHHVRHEYRSQNIDVQYIPSDKNPSDILTKEMAAPKHIQCLQNLPGFEHIQHLQLHHNQC